MTDTSKLRVVAASELQVGDQVPEQDGFLMNVAAVEISGSKVNITFKSDFSSHRALQQGVTQTYMCDELLYKFVG